MIKHYLTLTTLVLLLLATNKAQAVCICDDQPNIQTAFTESAAIFMGRVEETTWLNPFDYVVKIKVHQSWKSIQDEYAWVASTKYSKECGFDFITGHEYLIYAHNATRNLLAASKCSRTKHWSIVTEGEKKLLKKPLYYNENY